MNKTIITTAIVALLTAGVSANLLASASNAETKAAQEAAAVSMEQAITIAEQATNGKNTEAEFELEDGQAIYEVEVTLADGSEVEVTVDAQSGVVLSQEADDDKHDCGHEGKEKDDLKA